MKEQGRKLFFLTFCFLWGVAFLFSGYFFLGPKAIETVFPLAKISESSFVSTSLIKASAEKRAAVLFLVGDIMLGREVEKKIEEEGKGDFKFPFLKIADNLKEADLVFGNLEGTISDKGKKVGSRNSFRFEPEAIEGLTYAGFNVLSLANNHALDYTRTALEDTFSRLNQAGIDYVGAGPNKKEAYSPLIKKIRGLKIAFLAYVNIGLPNWVAGNDYAGVAWVDKNNLVKIKKDIEKAKNQADILIVSLHAGSEYTQKLIPFQTEFAKTAIDSGADIVVGHHPHVVQKNEKYKDGWIFYSLGNFIFDQDFSKETMQGQIVKVLIKNGKIKEVIPINIKINKFFQPEVKE